MTSSVVNPRNKVCGVTLPRDLGPEKPGNEDNSIAAACANLPPGVLDSYSVKGTSRHSAIQYISTAWAANSRLETEGKGGITNWCESVPSRSNARPARGFTSFVNPPRMPGSPPSGTFSNAAAEPWRTAFKNERYAVGSTSPIALCGSPLE